MLLGKRPRRTIKRTPSLAELSVDMDTAEGAQASGGDPLQRRTRRPPMVMEGVPMTTGYNSSSSAWPPQQLQHYDPSDWLNNTNHPMVPTSKPRWHSTDLAGQPSGFLRVCGLCKRRLGPGRETFMYRGEVAFCSQECRQQQINLDEMKEKCFPASMKPPQSASKSEASGDGKIVA